MLEIDICVDRGASSRDGGNTAQIADYSAAILLEEALNGLVVQSKDRYGRLILR